MTTPPARLDVLSVGEAMAVFCPDPPGPIRRAQLLRMSVAGAEANVVTHLAGLGLSTMFASRVGDDPFGELILRALEGAGVDTRAVVRVPGGRTGVYVKDTHGGRTAVY